MKNWLYSYNFFLYSALTSAPAAGFVQKIEPQQCYFLYIWAPAKQVGPCLWHFQVCAWLCAVLSYSRTPGWGHKREFLVLGDSSSRNYKITTNPERIFTIFRIRAIRTSIYLGFFFSVGLNLEFLRAGQWWEQNPPTLFPLFFPPIPGVLLEDTWHIYGDSERQGRLLPGPAQHPGCQVSWGGSPTCVPEFPLPWRLRERSGTRSNLWDISCPLEADSCHWLWQNSAPGKRSGDKTCPYFLRLTSA